VVGSAGPGDMIVARLRAAGCVFAEDEARLISEVALNPEERERLVQRRIAGEPLEYLLGWAEFCGLRISVAPGVFVPRRRTEALVREAVRLLSPVADASAVANPRPVANASAVAVDLCCGSGAIAVAIRAAVSSQAVSSQAVSSQAVSSQAVSSQAVSSQAVPSLEVYAADVDPAAVECARGNVEPAGGRVFQGDLFDALPAELRGRVSVVIANAPYVPTEAIASMPREARDHEHRIALDGGSDGTDLHRRIAAEAPTWLAPGGHLLIESSRDQAPTTARHMAEAGLAVRIVEDDEYDATVVVGDA
jgi:release factor glutamine methyltransferase